MTTEERLEMLTKKYSDELAQINKDLKEKFGEDIMAKMEYVLCCNKERL